MSLVSLRQLLDHAAEHGNARARAMIVQFSYVPTYSGAECNDH